jgi:hypothetical protein
MRIYNVAYVIYPLYHDDDPLLRGAHNVCELQPLLACGSATFPLIDRTRRMIVEHGVFPSRVQYINQEPRCGILHNCRLTMYQLG